MSARPRMSAIVGAACVAMLLAGCSSSGTVGVDGLSKGGAGAVTAGTSDSPSGQTGGASGDAGCSEALPAIQNAEKAQKSNDPQAALKVAATSIGQLRQAALVTQKPGGKDAMNKVADDMQAVVTQAESGQKPSTHQAVADAQVVAGICGA